jgi:hypothetical protein
MVGLISKLDVVGNAAFRAAFVFLFVFDKLGNLSVTFFVDISRVFLLMLSCLPLYSTAENCNMLLLLTKGMETLLWELP